MKSTSRIILEELLIVMIETAISSLFLCGISIYFFYLFLSGKVKFLRKKNVEKYFEKEEDHKIIIQPYLFTRYKRSVILIIFTFFQSLDESGEPKKTAISIFLKKRYRLEESREIGKTLIEKMKIFGETYKNAISKIIASKEYQALLQEVKADLLEKYPKLDITVEKEETSFNNL
ncbi:MAG: hypothetical protein ABIG60_02595 [Patescibacteria group bacterium]